MPASVIWLQLREERGGTREQKAGGRASRYLFMKSNGDGENEVTTGKTGKVRQEITGGKAGEENKRRQGRKGGMKGKTERK